MPLLPGKAIFRLTAVTNDQQRPAPYAELAVFRNLAI